MAYLHVERVEFTDAVNLAADRRGILPAVVEKDYYVTVILHLLAEKLSFVVFKGGTSLSKCHKAIMRFSEDIDITVDTKLSQGQMGILKKTIEIIADELGLTIQNLNETRSRRSYNKYIVEYPSVGSIQAEEIPPTVILETSLAEISFPTIMLPVHSYLGDMLEDESPDLCREYMLDPFEMKVQGIDRTLIDKVFAICDYYLKGEVKRNSRHIYDIYKLLPIVPQTQGFRQLISDVRHERAANQKLCPSAQPGVDVSELLKKLIEEDVYKKDYDTITERILEEDIPYETALESIRRIADSGLFELE